MTRKTRVRFAPSPTGPLHIGGVRTALYNYLYAKKRGGNFILRIEDTDSQRFVPGAEEYIIEALAWCGITPDEGVIDGKIAEAPDERNPFAPYRQSQRREIYHSYALELIQKGFAYYAFDSSENLEAMRSEAESKGETFTYNYTVREHLDTSLKLSAPECEYQLQSGDQWVIRFKMPVDKIIKMRDLIRGDIEVNSSTLDDKVLWKAADRLPTYHLANVVDDKLMEISDVIRGEEWLPSLPLHYMLYEAFGWNDIRPNFAHLSLLLKPDGKGKLSKRDGERLGFPVFPMEWRNDRGEISRGYREEGYYPEAFINLLAFLGWNPGTEQELFSLEELTESFSLERVVKSGAKFNPEKAKWFNQEYLRKKSTDELVREFLPLLESKGVKRDIVYVTSAVEMIRERASFVNEFWGLCDYLFCAPQSYDMKVKEKFWREDTPAVLNDLIKELACADPFTKEAIEILLPSIIKERGWQMGAVMNTLRLLLVGESKGASVADIMSLIGKEESISRLERGISTL
jgi:glutamyl-tRNA synthetase